MALNMAQNTALQRLQEQLRPLALKSSAWGATRHRSTVPPAPFP